MHALAQLIQILAAPLVAVTNALAPALAEAAHRPLQDSDFTVSSFVISVAFIGLLVGWWASFTHARWANHRIDTKRRESRFQGALRVRDMLLKESQLPVIVLGRDVEAPLSYGDGSIFLQQCLAGADAIRLAALLDTLIKQGTPFETRCAVPNKRGVLVRGMPIGRSAAVFFRELGVGEGEVDFQEALRALPTPVWVRDQDLELAWGNQAFLDVVQAKSVEDAIRENAVIERSERDLALGALDGATVSNVRRYTSIAGQRRAISINLNRLPDMSLLGMAVDVTEAAQAEAKLKLHLDTYSDLLDRIPVAIANFSADRRLTHYNSAYQQLWCLDEAWLKTNPAIDEILDRLRDAGRLPEQRDFRSWKEQHLQPFSDASRYTREIWHTAGERSIEVQAQPDLEGGVFYLFEDVSETMRLTGKLALLTRVQRATLDTVDEGLAIFDPSGRLAMHNTAFTQSWGLGENDVEGGPHFSKLATLCCARKGNDGLWDIVSTALASGEPNRYAEWGKVTRADGRIISVSMSHLPNGAIAVMFKDLTDMERFSEAMLESPPAAA